ncbi:hypothetical protein F5Y03DRAFT_401331 [Xylaria venustula]|nr:hypothetical protein F5Y03DRAFT_401331 [Xylaria venustula]
MATISNKPLPPGASTELWKVAEWLQGPKAKYSVTDNIKFCSNPEELAYKTANLLETFLKEMPKAPLESVVAAIRFEQPAVIPIEAGWVVNLIPVDEVHGVAIEDHTLYSNHYAQLNQDARISGSFYALVFMFRFDPRNRRERMRNFLKRALKMS